MTGDLSNTSWASSRVGHAQFHRSMSMLQHQSFIPGMRKVGKWIVDAGYVAGKWRRPAIKLGWTPPRFESPNPLEDAKVSALRVRNGQSTLGMEIASDGNDPHEVWRERAKELAEHERLKLILDTDPGKTMAPGGAGAVAYTQDAPPTDTNPAGS
jgi:capsid protein